MAYRAYNEHTKMPGYTGHVKGLMEVFGRTTVHAQMAAMNPAEAPKHMLPPEKRGWAEKRDPCNNENIVYGATMRKHDSLWPDEATPQESAGKERKAALVASSFTLGDKRYEEKASTYARTFSRPGSARQTGIANGHSHVLPAYTENTPLRQLPKEEIKKRYERAVDRVEKSSTGLTQMRVNVAQRFLSKLNSATNCNGFAMRKTFRIFDQNNSGIIEYEEFRSGLNQFGLEFDEYQALALFSVYDEKLEGLINYTRFMADTLDREYYLLAFAGTPGFEENIKYL